MEKTGLLLLHNDPDNKRWAGFTLFYLNDL